MSSPNQTEPEFSDGKQTESISTPPPDPSNEKTTLAETAEPEIRPVHGIKWALAVIAILCSTFLFSLDTTVVADIQPNIIETFNSISKLPWLASGFVLPAAALILPWAKTYSIFNIKYLYISHVLLFEIGSAISGAAPNMNSLIIGRVVAGIGGSGMYQGGITYFTATTTQRERSIYMALIGPVWGLGTVLGPIVGGAFANSSATWRWGFYINLIFGALCAPIIIFLLPSIDLQPTTPLKDKIKQNDFLGIIVLAGWTTSFIMAISFGGSVFTWKSGSEMALWVLSGVLLVLFILTQRFNHPFIHDHAKNRLYPTHLLGNWKLLNLQFQTFAASGIVYVPLFYIPLFFQFANGESSLTAAVKLLPFIFMIVFFSLANGFLMARLGYFMPWYIFAASTCLIGTTLLFTVSSSTSTSSIYGYSILIGAGGGSFLLSSFAIAPSLVSIEHTYDAVAAVSLAQPLGIVTFVSIAGNIFQNLGTLYVTPLVPENLRDNVRPLIAGTSSALFDQLDDATKVEVTEAIVRAIDRTYPLVMAASAVCLVLAPFLGTGRVN